MVQVVHFFGELKKIFALPLLETTLWVNIFFSLVPFILKLERMPQ
jgi:hypothetical protein